MKMVKTSMTALVSMSLLAGCWDQHNLKDVKLAMATGFDLAPEGKIIQTITIPIFSPSAGGMEVKGNQVVITEGDTPRDARNIINHKVAETMDASKLLVLLFGEEYAKQDIYTGLDIFYRDPKSSLLANAAVVHGKASEVLSLKPEDKKTMSEYLNELITSEQDTTILPKQSRPLISDILDPGTDFVLPLIEPEETEAKIIGLAMFNEHKYTGQFIPVLDSTLYLLMADQLAKRAWIKLKIHEGSDVDIRNFLMINVLNSKRDLSISGNKIHAMSVDLSMHLKIEIMEYHENDLVSEKIKALTQTIAERLTEQANAIIKMMQQANSDALGIGSYIRAYHHAAWDKTSWEKVYPDLNFKAHVTVEITKHGVFN
ncbi:Ger(x)C family spore germination protein [Paenibacillus aestuarii]|uniref:Ger(X)C family spore germination protein n=1 Tax=Paenibacillus aestuarii TaxID=516965 RepID=A0ABW0K4C3_9BACL|nr:Ger(x)C family spore germination protein [Paenibacillus aestuarii]